MPGDPRKQLQEEIRRGRQAFYGRLARDAGGATARLEQAYARTLDGLKREFAAFDRWMATDEQTALMYAQDQMRIRLERELADLQSAVIDVSAQMQKSGVEQGVRAGVAALQRGGVSATFHLPTVETIQAGIGYVDSAAWRAAVGKLAGYHAEAAADAVLDALARGINPRQTARWLRDYFVKSRRPMVDALRMARTTQLYAAREGTRQIYERTGVEQWVWSANLGNPRTCFPAGTMVMTEHGEKPIETIRPGERVLTHTGKLRTVKAAMRRMYHGGGASLLTNAGKVTMTEDHPVLVERDRELYWMTAEQCRIGDVVFIHRDYLPDDLKHLVRGRAIERRIRHTNDTVAPISEPLHLGGVGLLPVTVPVDAVDLDGEVHPGQVEVNRVFSQRDFLLKFLAKLRKAKAEVLLRLGFAGEGSVAPNAAKLLVVRGRRAEHLAAIPARDVKRRAATILGAVLTVVSAVRVKQLPAALTRHALNTWIATFVAAKARALWMVALLSGELLTATFARRVNRLAKVFLPTLAAAKAPGASPRMLEALAAPLAGIGDAHILSGATALIGTIAPTAAPRPGVRNDERLPANFTDFFCHVRIIAHLAEEIHEEVFNLEVEGDHTFVANGLVVHNCMACVCLHGTVHPVSEVLNDHHNGRCAPIPVTPRWAELGIAGGRELAIETGVDWFRKLPAEQQASIMGPKFYEAWTAGAFRLEQVPRLYHNDIFGPMWRKSTLAELLAS